MARLAWFAPLPPARSGIAAYNVELLPLLAAHHEIEVFTESSVRGEGRGAEGGQPPHAFGLPPGGPAVRSAHEFVWRHAAAPYDLVVYQLGNASCHDFMWPHLARFPGLVVLHDGQLHHERSRALLSRGRVNEYKAEFRYNHPDAPEHLPELVIAALGGSLYYLYPMVRWVLRTARLVAVHSSGLREELTKDHPGVEVRRMRHGMIDPVADGARRNRSSIRSRHGIPEDAILFAAFGLVTPEKRISAALRALARLAPAHPASWLLLVGDTTRYYDAYAEAKALGVAERVRIAGWVADEDLPAYVLASDICLSLRWPTSRETSGTWIRAIACGRPTIVTDLAHTADIPAVDPRSWQPVATGTADGEGASVAIDLLDEEESLFLAMSRLAQDSERRRTMGAAARRYWEAHHTMERAVEDYLGVIERALERPVPHVRDLPKHLLEDETALARSILGQMGVEIDLF